MSARRGGGAALVALILATGGWACRRGAAPGQASDGSPSAAGGPPDQEPPVALNADSPIQYPPRLYDQKVEGDVVLRLFVDSTGRLAPESSRVAESSGYPALDSAALGGAKKLRFAPARRHGLTVAAAFLQPIEFRHPAASGAVMRGAPDTGSTAPPRPAPPPRRIRPDTSRPPALDSTRARPETTRARPDSGALPY